MSPEGAVSTPPQPGKPATTKTTIIPATVFYMAYTSNLCIVKLSDFSPYSKVKEYISEVEGIFCYIMIRKMAD
jgi:hypothetical protein